MQPIDYIFYKMKKIHVVFIILSCLFSAIPIVLIYKILNNKVAINKIKHEIAALNLPKETICSNRFSNFSITCNLKLSIIEEKQGFVNVVISRTDNNSIINELFISNGNLDKMIYHNKNGDAYYFIIDEDGDGFAENIAFDQNLTNKHGIQFDETGNPITNKSDYEKRK